jgi:serine/threonine protein kinase
MDSKRWQQVDRLFQAALEMDPGQRAEFLDRACLGDDSLRKEVESLLDSDEQGLSLIDTPAFGMVAEVFAGHATRLSDGHHIGHYKILGLLGTGGMGEVYLAHDGKLGRKVALKLLPADFTLNQEWLDRFKQEARAASALNHPNILTIYEIGHYDGRHCIATEFIEGKTLREVLNQSKPSVSKTLDIAVQVASALGAAHQAGIVHRDIKPENIMLRRDGYAKVLDFGLAKLTEQPTADGSAETVDKLDTVPGVVMGTVKYMSPEQARGVEVDGRSDIFSLGVVLYEMMTGRAPFEGETPSDLIASILKVEPPPLTDFLPDAPPEAQLIIRKALSKERNERYQTVNDMLADLKRLKEDLELKSKVHRALRTGGNDPTAVVTAGGRTEVQTADQVALSTGGAPASRTLSSINSVISSIKKSRTRVAVALTLLIVAVAVAGYEVYKLIRPGRPSYFQNVQVSRITTSGKAGGAAISPDGKYVAYLEGDGKQQNLWVRVLATSSNVLVASATSIQQQLTFSPDGNYLYYVSRGQNDTADSLYQMPALGGVSQKLLTGIDSFAAVSPDGRRLAFVRNRPGNGSAIMVANADGSDEREIVVREFPGYFLSAAWSPDGNRVACVGGRRDDEGFYADVVEISAEGGEPRPLTHRRWDEIRGITWFPDGSGLIIASDQIWQLSYPGGEERRVTTDLNNYHGLSMTKDSTALVSAQNINFVNLYIQAAADAGSAAQITSGSAREDGFSGISWTPDGKMVYSSAVTGHHDIWIMEPDGSNQKQLTVGLGSGAYGISVSPDGRYIVFVSNRAGPPQVWRVDIDGSNPRHLTFGLQGRNPFISPDGKWVFYFDGAGHASKVPIEGGEPVQLASPFSDVVAGGFSPDGKLIAYIPANDAARRKKLSIASSETGELIKVIDLPRGAMPRRMQWTPDGRAITYINTGKNVSNLWMQPLDDGPPIQLTDFKEYTIYSFAWSPDGKYLAFNRGFQTSDVVLINNIK